MSDELKVGAVFDGKYEILSVLGSGTAGTVYKALELELGRQVAIKSLNAWSGQSLDESALSRFKREARVLCKLNHKGILQVYRFGISELPFLVTEYLEGEDLRALLNREGALSYGLCLNLAIQLAEALQHAHLQGVVHRDLKPENLLILGGAAAPELKLIDFGLCKPESSSSTAQHTLTGTGDILGTALYMSPEQVRGMQVDQRSDVYSFALLLFEMICGFPPLLGKTLPETLNKQLNENIPRILDLNPNCGLPAEFDELIQEASAKKPDKRLQSFEEVLLLLNTISPPQPALRFTPGKGSVKSKKGLPIIFGIAAPVCLAGALALYLYLNPGVFQESVSPEQVIELSSSALKPVIESGKQKAAVEMAERSCTTDSFKRWPPQQKAELYYRYFLLFKEAGMDEPAQVYLLSFLRVSIPLQGLKNDLGPQWDERVSYLADYLLKAKVPRQVWKAINTVLEKESSRKHNTVDTRMILSQLKLQSLIRSWQSPPRAEWEQYCKNLTGFARSCLPLRSSNPRCRKLFNDSIDTALSVAREHKFLALEAYLKSVQAEGALTDGNLNDAEKYMEECRSILGKVRQSEVDVDLKLSSRETINKIERQVYSVLLERASAQGDNAKVRQYQKILSQNRLESESMKQETKDKLERREVMLDSIR